MRVLHVVPSVSPIRGGSTVAVLETVQALRDCGVEAEIITTNDDGPNLLDVPLRQRVQFEGVPVTFFPRYSPSLHALSEFAISVEHTRWLWQQSRQYDLIEINSLFSYVCTAAGWVARWRQVPYVITPHGHFAPWVIRQGRQKKEIYNALFEQANLQQSTAIHCTTTTEAENVRSFGITAPTFTVPLGVYPPQSLPAARQNLRDRYGIPATRPIILFLSRFHPKKRPDFLLEVLSQVQHQQDFHLLLAGSGSPEYTAFIESRIDALGLRDRTTLPGFLSGTDKALALQGSDLFVLPSFGENFGIAVAEAMAVGLPVVITPEVEIAADLKAADAGLVLAGTPSAWIEGLQTLLADPDQGQRLGQNGQRLAQSRYNWKTVGDSLASAYAAILNRQPVAEVY